MGDVGNVGQNVWVCVCVCVRISGDAEGVKESWGVSRFSLCVSPSLADCLCCFLCWIPPHTPPHAHHSYVPDAVLSTHTHTDISTHSHTRHMSLFVLVCCRDKTRLCYTPLQERQRTLISHTVCVCVLEWENVCVCGVCCCESVSPMQSFYFLHLLQAGFSASLAGILVPFFFSSHNQTVW